MVINIRIPCFVIFSYLIFVDNQEHKICEEAENVHWTCAFDSRYNNIENKMTFLSASLSFQVEETAYKAMSTSVQYTNILSMTQ